MTRNRIANLFSWFATLVASVSILGLVVVAVSAIRDFLQPNLVDGFLFLIVAAWLLLLGLGTLAAAAIARVLETDDATPGQRRRTHITLIVGAISFAVGSVFGVGATGG